MNSASKNAVRLALVAASLGMVAACTDSRDRESNLGEQSQWQGRQAVNEERQVVTTKRVHENIPTVVTGQELADINRMGDDDFEALGLPESIADKIDDYRDTLPNDRFTSVDQLLQVPGMDQVWFAKNRGKLGISNQEAGRSN